MQIYLFFNNFACENTLIVKKALAIIIPLATVLLIAPQFSSCEKYVLPEMSLTPDTLYFRANADSSTVNVKANIKWDVSKSGQINWLEFSPDEGEGDGEVKIKVTASTESSREATLTFRSETLEKKLVVIQSK
mgnify:CR=1 FL=1